MSRKCLREPIGLQQHTERWTSILFDLSFSLSRLLSKTEPSATCCICTSKQFPLHYNFTHALQAMTHHSVVLALHMPLLYLFFLKTFSQNHSTHLFRYQLSLPNVRFHSLVDITNAFKISTTSMTSHKTTRFHCSFRNRSMIDRFPAEL